jgi:hypothetical protein
MFEIFKKKDKSRGICIGGSEFGKPFFTRSGKPGQGMTVDIGAFWQKFAKECIAAATKPAEAQGKTVADLVAEGEDAFFAAVAAGDAKHFGKISELNKKSIFAEAVQILGVPGYRIMYDPMGDYHARAIPEAELRCGWHLPAHE